MVWPKVNVPVAAADEEEVVIVENVQLKEVGVPPGLHELEEGFKLQHVTGGPVCGGYADMDRVNKLL